MYLRYFEVIVIAIIQNYQHGWIHYANEHLYFEINKKYIIILVPTYEKKCPFLN